MSETPDNSESTHCPCGSGLQIVQCCGVEGRTAVNADVYAYVSMQGVTSEREVTPEIKHAIQTISDNPALFPARVNVLNDKAWFVKMSSATYRDSVFLDPSRMKGTCVIEADIAWLREVCTGLKWNPTSFIFHSAFCGSTLMSQILENVYHCLSLREPELLGNLLYYQNSNADEEQKSYWLDNLLKLISRRFSAEECVVVKANDHANPLMPILIEWRKDIPILFMYTPLNEFIAGCLKAENRKEWIKHRYESVKSHLPEIFPHMSQVGVNESDYGEIAAVYWSYNLAMYLKICLLNLPSVKSLDFNDMLNNPMEAVLRCGKLFGLKHKEGVNPEMTVQTAFGVYSKNSQFKYSPEQRRRELQKQISEHEDEQTSGVRLAQLLLGDSYPASRLPNDLFF